MALRRKWDSRQPHSLVLDDQDSGVREWLTSLTKLWSTEKGRIVWAGREVQGKFTWLSRGRVRGKQNANQRRLSRRRCASHSPSDGRHSLGGGETVREHVDEGRKHATVLTCR